MLEIRNHFLPLSKVCRFGGAALVIALQGCGEEFHSCDGEYPCATTTQDTGGSDGATDGGGSEGGNVGGSDANTQGSSTSTGSHVGISGAGGEDSNSGGASSTAAGGTHDQTESAGAAGAGGEQQLPEAPLQVELVPGVRDPAIVPSTATLVVSDANGDFVESVKVDSEGSATVRDFPSGGAITVLMTRSNGATYLSTYFDVSGRTILHLPGYPRTTFPPYSGQTMSVTVNASAPSGTTWMTVQLPDGLGRSAAGSEATVDAAIDCGRYPTYNVLVEADIDGELTTWNELHDQPCTPGGAVTHELNATRTELEEFSFHVSPIAIGTPRLDLVAYLYRGDPPTQTFRQQRIVEPPAVEENVMLRLPRADADEQVLNGTFMLADGYPNNEVSIQRRGASVPDSITWNPDSGIAQVTEQSIVDTEERLRPEVTFALREVGPLGDAIAVDVKFTEGTWTGWLRPNSSGTVRLPKLPAGIVEEYFPEGDVVAGPTIWHHDYVLVTGYDELLDRMTEPGVQQNYTTHYSPP